MAKCLVEATYTSEGLRGLKKNKASGRKQARRKVMDSVGGTVEAVHYELAAHDVILIADVPDIVSAASVSVAVSCAGLAPTKTTALLTVEEMDRALEKAASYRAPGA